MKHLILLSHSRPKTIRLNNEVFLRGTCRHIAIGAMTTKVSDWFENLERALSSIQPYTSVCWGMRADILTAFFLLRNFHVVFSPFVGRESQPAATKYLDRYGPLMASVTIEVDMTKLCGGARPEAARFDPRPILFRMRKLVEGFVDVQFAHRGPRTRMENLRVVVIRNSCFGAARRAGQYITPDAHVEYVLAPIKALGHHVGRLSLFGTSVGIASDILGSFQQATLEEDAEAKQASPLMEAKGAGRRSKNTQEKPKETERDLVSQAVQMASSACYSG
ncbi:hypothetical protein VTJ04DRAFT_7277 [Mycothermus thermophilus]|uniref:uncharacterized protein n=1 Tax=Humicola insolens TaxID=85995 RepID=UPI0037432E3F